MGEGAGLVVALTAQAMMWLYSVREVERVWAQARVASEVIQLAT